MIAPQEEFYPEPQTATLMILFRIVSRRSWDNLQNWSEALPGSHVEHLMFGLYVLVIEAGGARRLTK